MLERHTNDPYDAPFVVAVEPHDDHTLTFTIEGGEKRSFDMKPYLAWPVLEPLRDLHLFCCVKVVYGSLEWPGERDPSRPRVSQQAQ